MSAGPSTSRAGSTSSCPWPVPPRWPAPTGRDEARGPSAGRASVFAGRTDVAYVPAAPSLEVTGTAAVADRDLRCAGARRVAAAPVPARHRRGGPGRAPGRRQLLARGPQLRRARRRSRRTRSSRSRCSPRPATGARTRRTSTTRTAPGSRPSSRRSTTSRPVAGRARDGGTPTVGYQRVYGTAERPIDVFAEVRTGDVVLVPHGWHGPSMAAPGYDLYYLNVMAGPGDERAWLICDDPATAGSRDLGRPGRRPEAALGGRPMSDDDPADRRPGDGEFLAAQWSSATGCGSALFAGCFGIFGHGNVAGIGQALLSRDAGAGGGTRPALPYVLARNEQAMVHTSVAYARQKDRLQTWVCTRLGGPGLDEHGHRGRAGDDQPAAGPAAALRHLRDPAVGAGAPGARGAVRRRRQRQRRVPAGVPLLRPGLPRRAAAVGAAPGDARAHRPGRDRRGHAGAAAGRAGRGPRLAGRAVRRAHLARAPGRRPSGRASPRPRTSSAGRGGR